MRRRGGSPGAANKPQARGVASSASTGIRNRQQTRHRRGHEHNVFVTIRLPPRCVKSPVRYQIERPNPNSVTAPYVTKSSARVSTYGGDTVGSETTYRQSRRTIAMRSVCGTNGGGGLYTPLRRSSSSRIKETSDLWRPSRTLPMGRRRRSPDAVIARQSATLAAVRPVRTREPRQSRKYLLHVDAAARHHTVKPASPA